MTLLVESEFSLLLFYCSVVGIWDGMLTVVNFSYPGFDFVARPAVGGTYALLALQNKKNVAA